MQTLHRDETMESFPSEHPQRTPCCLKQAFEAELMEATKKASVLKIHVVFVWTH
jgi:hypothetical protein